MSPPESPARRKARQHLSNAFLALGPLYSNLAGLIRNPGYETFWITPALDALTALVLLCPDADDEVSD